MERVRKIEKVRKIWKKERNRERYKERAKQRRVRVRMRKKTTTRD